MGFEESKNIMRTEAKKRMGELSVAEMQQEIKLPEQEWVTRNDIIVLGNEVSSLGIKMNEIAKATSDNTLEINDLKNYIRNDIKNDIEDIFSKNLLKFAKGLPSPVSYTIQAAAYDCDEIAKRLSIKNLNGSVLKFYLYKKKVLDIRYNRTKRTYRLIDDVSKIPEPFNKWIVVQNSSRFKFSPEIIGYLECRRKEICEIVAQFNRKEKAYTKAHREIVNKNNKEILAKIHEIAGIGPNYHQERYEEIYDEFERTYHPNFRKEARIHKQQYGTTYLKYAIENIDGAGEVLLRIACDLYV